MTMFLYSKSAMKKQDIKDAVKNLDPLTDEQLRELSVAAPTLRSARYCGRFAGCRSS